MQEMPLSKLRELCIEQLQIEKEISYETLNSLLKVSSTEEDGGDNDATNSLASPAAAVEGKAIS